jgi:prevent-host-death family protein
MTMKTRTIGAGEFKAKCLALLDEVAEGEEIIVTKRGKPVARVTPIGDKQWEGLAGTLTYQADDIVSPIEGLWEGASAPPSPEAPSDNSPAQGRPSLAHWVTFEGDVESPVWGVPD